MDPIAVHFHEIALKGGNRAYYEHSLRKNLIAALQGAGELKVHKINGSMLVDGEGDGEEVLRRVSNVFGVAFAMPVRKLPLDLEAVGEMLLQQLRELKPKSFRIVTRRRDKRFPKTSIEINRLLGMYVQDRMQVEVDLHDPEVTTYVVVLNDGILLGMSKHGAVGGLPVGTSGRVAMLLSGGIDSPVAAWRMMKRGCHVEFVHFHSYPRVDRKSIEKAEDLVERLTQWQFTSRLHLVPLSEIQAAVRLNCPEPLRVILYRRFMVRLAERIALRHKCKALATGESVGQVASQTLQNLASVDAVARMPILRPLCGSDKDEIVQIARKIGTFETSILPDQDCCKLFLPPKPALHSSQAECLEAEKALDVDALIKDALDRSERVKFRWPK
ncbi:MAG: tRNA uracil 4-sulfurtransferase ThiI [Myxococcaceae bacterium]